MALRFCALLPIVLITESSALACSGEPDGSPTNGDPSGGAVRLIGDQMSPSLMSHATSKALVINMATVIGQTCVSTLPPYIAHHQERESRERILDPMAGTAKSPLTQTKTKKSPPSSEEGGGGGGGPVCWAKHVFPDSPKCHPLPKTDEVRGGNMVPVLRAEGLSALMGPLAAWSTCLVP